MQGFSLETVPRQFDELFRNEEWHLHGNTDADHMRERWRILRQVLGQCPGCDTQLLGKSFLCDSLLGKNQIHRTPKIIWQLIEQFAPKLAVTGKRLIFLHVLGRPRLGYQFVTRTILIGNRLDPVSLDTAISIACIPKSARYMKRNGTLIDVGTSVGRKIRDSGPGFLHILFPVQAKMSLHVAVAPAADQIMKDFVFSRKLHRIGCRDRIGYALRPCTGTPVIRDHLSVCITVYCQ